MVAYADSSALLKRYVDEPDSGYADELLQADPVLVTSWITLIEVRRNLARLVGASALARLRHQVEADFDRIALVECAELTARTAATIAETLSVRSLDAIHLASAQRLGIADLAFITFDLRQGQAARSLGMRVLGC